MKAQFNFESAGECFFGKVYRPIAKVSFLSLNTNLWIDTWMVVDTGIGSINKVVPIAFLDSNDVPPLLGRLGFMETFDTTFLKKRVVTFKE